MNKNADPPEATLINARFFLSSIILSNVSKTVTKRRSFHIHVSGVFVANFLEPNINPSIKVNMPTAITKKTFVMFEFVRNIYQSIIISVTRNLYEMTWKEFFDFDEAD